MKSFKHWTSIILGGLLLAFPLSGQKFFPDDPLETELPPVPAGDANVRNLSGLLDYFAYAFGRPGERHPSMDPNLLLRKEGIYPAQGINTLGEVPDGGWFFDRHYRKRMSPEELQRGLGDARPPDPNATWEVLTVRRFGVRPGMLIRDGEEVYLLRFDPIGHLEMNTGADMVSSRLVHALGYWTTEDYIVYFERDQLQASEAGEDVDSIGQQRDLLEEDIDIFLKTAARDQIKGYRALAHRIPAVKVLGPIQLFGTRSDDPNDLVNHEHRRDVRGFRVAAAWINHSYFATMSTVDAIFETQEGVPYVRHHYVDFVGALGSAYGAPKSAREGAEKAFEMGPTIKNFLGMGFYSPKWQRAEFPKISSVGRLEYEYFEPDKWTTETDNAPFANMLPDDAFWAAKRVMAFTDEEIRTIVQVGQYSDQHAEDWIVECLIGRRDKIGRTYFAKVLPLDRLRVEDSQLRFEDLERKFNYVPSRDYTISWAYYDNDTDESLPIGSPRQNDFGLPPVLAQADIGDYIAATIHAEEESKNVVVHLRKEQGGPRVVGIEHNWPGKIIADPPVDPKPSRSRYTDLSEQRRTVFDRHAKEYAEQIGKEMTGQEYFDSLSISEQTTFDGVTHALENTKLTDEEGNSIGIALDLVDRVERIAGAIPGRGGDEQFRVYFILKPGARDKLEASQEFARTHDNTVYHAGYPISYRQGGKPPSMQFSMDEDAGRADVDVDYRASKMPSSMWNGHLTAANSDVRAGNNPELHGGRWSGFSNWWNEVFGKLADPATESTALFKEPPEPPTPLPPDRASGTAIPEPADAIQEFLTDWLVRDDTDQAMRFFSERSMACVALDTEPDEPKPSPNEARKQLRQIIAEMPEGIGRPDNLTEALVGVLPWQKSIRVVDQKYTKEFVTVEVPDSYAKAFMCDVRSTEGIRKALTDPNPQYGSYYGAIFRFKVPGDTGGVLGLLFAKEGADWKIVAWQSERQ